MGATSAPTKHPGWVWQVLGHNSCILLRVGNQAIVVPAKPVGEVADEDADQELPQHGQGVQHPPPWYSTEQD